MYRIILLILFLIWIFIPRKSHQLSAGRSIHVFCYDGAGCGPSSHSWGGVCQSGSTQSPIDFSPQASCTSAPLEFNDKYSSDEFYINNNGHTVQIHFPETQPPSQESQPQLSGYGFDQPYVFAQAHFHWGRDSETGSEHSVNGSQYAMEMHLVHYDPKYPDLSAAADSGDPKGLAVLGIFIQPGSESDQNPGFDTIVANLPLEYDPNGVARLVKQKLDLNSLLPYKGEHFFRYTKGSLTTPPCTEVVIWTVIEEPLHVKPSQIEKFRKVEGSHHGEAIGWNFRPTQKLNERVVEYLCLDSKGIKARVADYLYSWGK